MIAFLVTTEEVQYMRVLDEIIIIDLINKTNRFPKGIPSVYMQAADLDASIIYLESF